MKDTRKAVRLLLINPKFPESFWSLQWAVKQILTDKRAINPPLGLATLAALCPPDWEIEIVDENIETPPLQPDAEIVGVCGMGVQFQRQRELLEHYNAAGCYTVAGGSFASLCPERYLALADSVIAGEAENIWPQFCRDYLDGSAQPLYRETGSVDIKNSPTPRFDLLKLDHYTSVSLQFSRGCPYRCEFCDIIVMFGRTPRTKSPAQIGRELDLLRAQRVRNVFFVDDNFIGNKKAAGELLRFLIDYQRRHRYRFRFGTEATINLASNRELLQLFRDAGFAWVFLGIETPDEEALKDTLKSQNTKVDILDAVREFYRNGIDVLSGFIIGFDNDTAETFERQYRFIMHSGIQVAMIGLLMALPKTPLHERLEREGRLIEDSNQTDNTKLGTNVIPKNMSYEQMLQSYRALLRRLFSDRGIARRIHNKMKYLAAPSRKDDYTTGEKAAIAWRFITRGILRGSPGRLVHFLGTLWRSRPVQWNQVITDWIAGLSMQNYILRHFRDSRDKDTQLALRIVQRIRQSIPLIASQAVSLSVRTGHPWVTLRLRLQHNDADFLVPTAKKLKKLMKKTAARLTLRIEALYAEQGRHLEQMLKLLAEYNDRVSIYIKQELQPLITADLSRFNIVLK